MREPAPDNETRIPSNALDVMGFLLPPSEVPINALMDAKELLLFGEALAALAQTECSIVLYDPEKPVPATPGSPIQFVKAPICAMLNCIERGPIKECEWNIHAAAHRAMETGKPVNADCVGGESVLYACPIMLRHEGVEHPKAAIVAAVNDIYNFHFADVLADRLMMPVDRVQELMCQTDKRYLNYDQLLRLRSIMEGYTRSSSLQITEQYAELKAMETVLGQQQELQGAYGRLDFECAIVGQIQRSLVPSEAPDIKGYSVATYYSPATRAGGDYYDFLPLDDGSCGVFLADVSGHGPGAAVIMAMLRALVHAYPGDLRNAESVLEYTNLHLCKNALIDQFATAFYAVMEPHGHAHVSSAGHNPPLLFCAATGNVIEPELDAGLPLAVGQYAEYSSVCLTMKPGDMLALYTDGFSEMMNESSETFGVEKLMEVIRENAPRGAEAARDAVLAATCAFAADRPPEDDRALVIMQKL